MNDEARGFDGDFEVASQGTNEAKSAPLFGMEFDRPLGVAAFAVLSIGLVMVYSSSSVYAARLYEDPEHFIKRQLLWCCFGVVAFAVGTLTPGHFLSRRAGWLMMGGVVLCAVVLVPGIGVKVGGARRWLDLGIVRFQPSEIAKIGVIVLLAALLSHRDRQQKKSTASLIIPVLLAQIPVALVLVEPDLGTALVIELIVGAMVFVGGLKIRSLALLSLTALPVFYHFVVGTPFRLRRILGYIDPWAYRDTVGYQITEALIAIGSGGIWGVGVGEGKQRLFFLPEAHTDFVLAILAEELGLVGMLLILSLFCVIVWRGLKIALRAGSTFDGYLAVGLTALIAVPAIFNAGVVTGLLPTKGLPLPLMSFGGSNLLSTLLALGLLMRIYRDDLKQRSGEASG
ncbi:MAG: putative lipid II flippase FtsW [Myxococcota bacterium]|nr:putative lipid II flippase FtsW [Myxococcota bacterium]